MDKNKVKLNICGTEYSITSDDDYDYVVSTGEKVDQKIKKILEKSPRISVAMGSVLTALEYCDIANKSEQKVATLRSQIKEYIDEIADLNKQKEILQSKLLEFEKLARELNTKTRENESLKAQITAYACDLKEVRSLYKKVCLELENSKGEIEQLGLTIKNGEKVDKQLEKYKADFEDLKNSHESTLLELKNTKNAVAALKSQNKCAQDEFFDMTQNFENEICSLQEKLSAQKLGDPVQEMVTFSNNYLEVAPVDFFNSTL